MQNKYEISKLKKLLPIVLLILPIYFSWDTKLFHIFNIIKALLIFTIFAANFKRVKLFFLYAMPLLIINLLTTQSLQRSLYYSIAGIIPAFMLFAIFSCESKLRNFSEKCFIFSAFIISLLNPVFLIIIGPNQYFDKNIIAFNTFISIFLLLRQVNFIKVTNSAIVLYISCFITRSYMGIFCTTILLLSIQLHIQIKKMSSNRKKIIFSFLLVMILFTFSISFFYFSNSLNRLKTRLFIYQRAVNIIKTTNWLTGTGFYTSRIILEKNIRMDKSTFHKTFGKTNNYQISHAHNFFLQQMLESGIPGTLFWIIIILLLLKIQPWNHRIFFLLLLLWLQVDYQFYYPSELSIVRAFITQRHKE